MACPIGKEIFQGPLSNHRQSFSKRDINVHNKYIASLSDQDRELLISYTAGSQGFQIIPDAADRLDEIIKNAPKLSKKYKVYNLTDAKYIANLEKNQVYKRPIFMSTTVDPTYPLTNFNEDLTRYCSSQYLKKLRCEYCCMLVLETNTGLIVKDWSVYPDQSELLLGKDLKFNIQNISHQYVSFLQNPLNYYIKYQGDKWFISPAQKKLLQQKDIKIPPTPKANQNGFVQYISLLPYANPDRLFCKMMKILHLKVIL